MQFTDKIMLNYVQTVQCKETFVVFLNLCFCIRYVLND